MLDGLKEAFLVPMLKAFFFDPFCDSFETFFKDVFATFIVLLVLVCESFFEITLLGFFLSIEKVFFLAGVTILEADEKSEDNTTTNADVKCCCNVLRSFK